ncbi:MULTISPECIES: DUF3300 domain-containing protein [Bradyrhizobium]|uniref:DUF3300 domain-containing protein n=1 Tax=Bradyrhizobium TaxID=374 RepID=UPI00155E6075|nr:MULTISPECIES: DUF3300 domain-containing protein [Bradyrhizobium]MDD1518814.1 DUF3300 domain-containing protein [Bradyrhizobium sp. WBAH30]MDD1541188.1 DUF3300 domain-containing protein [Bradyrhizobium sp. WBAH41]MDD1557188.1 DUF3300 domain-containing protein [Bradyrhizobium sp. WBAH23]MDD1563823.1 DUF3300 domain-containing protein [Bradyrhizobium sp. WBAH33]MDD1590008.1 DUF3300 domain-containing protein [Bradyrhizobium sp. WBAH42]
MFRCGKTLMALALLMATSVAATAQTTTTPAAPAPQAQPASTPAPTAELLKPEQLEALVAPIALYPDELLANVLAASTYPLEVVQADRWLKERKSLKGDALKTEVEKQGWDDSVKALASTADVLAMMSEQLDWTKKLGDAFLAQQPDVMDAIQRLRNKAYDNKKLVTTKQQKVSVQSQEGKQVVVIQQADPAAMYVPYYDPATVYGSWPYAEYPPYYWGYPSYIGAGMVAAGIAFGTAWAIGRWGNYWGGGCNWGNRNVYVNHRTTNIGNGWQHNPAHRGGVRYNNSNVQQRFGNNNLRAGVSDRMDFRGRDGNQVLRPNQGAGDRAGDRGGPGDRAGNRGDRPGAGDRPSAGTRDRPGGGDRAGAGDRAKGANKGASKGGGDRAKAANRAGGGAANRGGGANRGGAMNVSSGRSAAAASARGRSSMASMPRGGGGGPSFAGRGGGGGMAMRGGGGGGGFRGGGGGGRRSDIALKHDVVLLGHLSNGLGYYRFSYIGSGKAYVGVMAQEVEQVMPDAVTRGSDGYLRVHYEKLRLTFRTYRDWLARGAKIPAEVMP